MKGQAQNVTWHFCSSLLFIEHSLTCYPKCHPAKSTKRPSLQCRRFLWGRNLLAKAPCWNFPKRGGDGASQRERGGGGEREEKTSARKHCENKKHPLIRRAWPLFGKWVADNNKTTKQSFQSRNKRVKKDTLFKDREPQKPYPIPRHIHLYSPYMGVPPPPPGSSLKTRIVLRKTSWSLSLSLS